MQGLSTRCHAKDGRPIVRPVKASLVASRPNCFILATAGLRLSINSSNPRRLYPLVKDDANQGLARLSQPARIPGDSSDGSINLSKILAARPFGSPDSQQ